MINGFREGERIYFRPLELEDLEVLQRWINDPENHQFFTIFGPVNRGQEREWLEGIPKREGTFAFGIALKAGDRPIGTIELRCGDRPHRSGEIGIMIGERGFKGQGYGTEAMRLILAYGFRTLNLHRIGLRVFANNPRGIRCYEKAGFKREGVLREARWWDGRWWDVLEYGILDREWTGEAQGTAK